MRVQEHHIHLIYRFTILMEHGITVVLHGIIDLEKQEALWIL